MTTFLLIRHAATDAVGTMLSGRRPAVFLNDEGRRQAQALAEWLSSLAIRRVYSSPLGRALETARPLAERLGLEVAAAAELNELDFGDWTGRTFEELATDRKWRPFNSYRSGTRVPGGELMLEVQARAVSFMLRLRDEFPDETIALVSHCDLIRSMLAYYLGMPLDLLLRIEIRPASVSMVRLHDFGPEILVVNARAAGLE